MPAIPARLAAPRFAERQLALSAHEAPVTGGNGAAPDGAEDLPPFDITTAHPARVYDYLLGGKDNFAADRAAAEAIIEVSQIGRAHV